MGHLFLEGKEITWSKAGSEQDVIWLCLGAYWVNHRTSSSPPLLIMFFSVPAICFSYFVSLFCIFASNKMCIIMIKIWTPHNHDQNLDTWVLWASLLVFRIIDFISTSCFSSGRIIFQHLLCYFRLNISIFFVVSLLCCWMERCNRHSLFLDSFIALVSQTYYMPCDWLRFPRLWLSISGMAL